jgi:hypothetical protein
MRRFIVLAAAVCVSAPAIAGAQTLTVTVLDRRDSDTEYSYVVPGSFQAQSSGTAHCSGTPGYGYAGTIDVNCYGSAQTTGTSTPAHRTGYQVRGATIALQLPDGRVAVVNCVSKYALRGDYINRRSCRAPMAGIITAEFKNDTAKLYWSVSLSGQRTQSETYNILTILPPSGPKVATRSATEPLTHVDANQPPLRVVPNDAIARCGNGWFVYVSRGSDTCAGAGGVAEWIKR